MTFLEDIEIPQLFGKHPPKIQFDAASRQANTDLHPRDYLKKVQPKHEIGVKFMFKCEDPSFKFANNMLEYSLLDLLNIFMEEESALTKKLVFQQNLIDELYEDFKVKKITALLVNM